MLKVISLKFPAIGEIGGVWWKGKADIVCNDCLIDIKTTSDINKFIYSASNYNYDSQAYVYHTLFGKPLKFLVIDKSNGQLGVFETTADFIEKGAVKVQKAIEVYNKFFSRHQCYRRCKSILSSCGAFLKKLKKIF